MTGQPLKDFQLSGDVKTKLDIEFGKKIAVEIRKNFAGPGNYFFSRNARFRQNRLIANGKMNMQAFIDRFDMNGKQNYVNINWSAIKVANTAISRMIGRWMGRSEKIQVTATDPFSLKERNEAADQATFVYENKDMLMDLEQDSGVPMVAPDQFVAEDKDELDQWTSEFNRLPEEIKYEKTTNDILGANGLYSTIKERLLHDSAEVGLPVTYTEMNPSGEIVVKWIRPENYIYSWSEFDDFRDTSWRGHLSSMKISELRSLYSRATGGKLSEEEIFQIASTSVEFQRIDKLVWTNEWNLSLFRPYDDWSVNIMTFEIKSFDTDKYTVTKTYEKPNTIIRKGAEDRLRDNQSIIEDKYWNIYKGVFAYDAQVMLEWGLKKNMIRPQDPTEIGDVEFSYSSYMYQNYDMRNVAVPEKIQEPLEQMILARLKIQQLVAKMKPAGAAINVDALGELDLGLGGSTSPLEAQRIWEQTGNLYYRGRDAEGRAIPLSITELANSGFLGQMEGLIKLYQFHYSVLRDELGVDPNLQQQATQPRVAANNVQSAIQASDDATDYMYDAYLYVMEQTGKKVACLLNTSVRSQAKKYRELFHLEEVKGRVFATEVRMLPTNEEVARLQATMDTAIASNPDFILYIDPFKITRIAKEDVKLAELYYRQSMKRMRKSQMEEASKNSQENAQAQQASIQAKAEADNALLKTKSSEEQKGEFVKGFFDLLKSGVAVPDAIQQLVTGIAMNIGVPLQQENQQMAQQVAMQEQQAMQEQGMEQAPEGEMQEGEIPLEGQEEVMQQTNIQ